MSNILEWRSCKRHNHSRASQGASRVLAEGRSRAFMQGYTSMESLLTPPLGYCFYCRCRIYHFQSLQSLLSAVLLVFQDHPSCRGDPSCSREGTTSFSRRWFTMLGSYKPSQVQLLVALHTIGCRDLHSPSLEFERHASRLITPDILRSLAMSMVNSLAQLIFDEPGVDIANRHGDRTVGGIPESSQHTEDR